MHASSCPRWAHWLLLRLALAGMSATVALAGPVLDSNFKPEPDAYVTALASAPGGRVLVAGNFSRLAGEARRFLGRLDSGGSLDATFRPELDLLAECVVVQRDGKIVIAGHFTRVNGENRARIARLNPDGSLDRSFDAGLGPVGVFPGSPAPRSVEIQPDGKIVIGGSFDTVDGVPRRGLARLNADGSLDLTFAPDVAGVFGSHPNSIPGVLCLARQADGRIVIGGQFTSVNGERRNGLARVNADGTLDRTFDPSPAPVGIVALVVQRDQKILAAGAFAALGGFAQRNLVRLDASGNADRSFAGSFPSIAHLFLQDDGRILASSSHYDAAGAHFEFARYTPWGAKDAAFQFPLGNPGSEVVPTVWNVAFQSDGSLVCAGDFRTIDGVPRNHLAKFNPAAASRLSNLSARGYIAAGSELTVGFVARGGEKSVLLRAVGPSLAQFGIADPLLDPLLEVSPTSVSATGSTNDNWGAPLGPSFAQAGAFSLPANSKDSALLWTFNGGGATMRVKSAVPGGSGIVLTEAYDGGDIPAGRRLINLSVLGFVGEGARVLTAGFVVQGEASKSLLIRAVGPSLANFGVANPLGDPKLALARQGDDRVIASNDDWSGAPLIAAFDSVRAFPLVEASGDAALLVNLTPGVYTIAVSGSGNPVGHALIEIYDLDP